MTHIDAMKLALEALENNRQTHHYCEDTWYSCPKHEDGCANNAEGNECNCGADKANVEIDAAINALRQEIEQAEKQEPVKWVGLTDAVMCHISMNHGFMSIDGHDFARAIEAKIKELNR